MTTTTYSVTGLTCGHCVSAVRTELGALPGVEDVAVHLAVGEASTVTVMSAAPLATDAVEAALDEAGDYHLVSQG
jgi:copper chaperone